MQIVARDMIQAYLCGCVCAASKCLTVRMICYKYHKCMVSPLCGPVSGAGNIR